MVRLWRTMGQEQVPGLLLLLSKSHLEGICTAGTTAPFSLECYEVQKALRTAAHGF